MNRKTFLKGSLALALLGSTHFALAASIPATVDQPVTITYYNYNLASAGLGADTTKKLIAEFEAANPNIKINAVGVPAQDLTTRVQADIAAGRGPDIAQMVFSDMDFIVNNLGAQPLEALVPADEMKAHFTGMSENGLKLGEFEGKTYGLAYTFSTPVLFYNADLFRKAGLDPNKPPKTWAEVKTASLALKEKAGVEGLATGIFGPSAGDWLLQGVLRSNNGDVLSEDRKTLTFAEPASIEAIAMLRDLNDSGAMVNQDINATLDGMAAGTLGMYLQTSAIQGALIKGATGNFELKASTMPSFGDKPVRPNNSGSALMILSADPLKQRAAWELMKFMTSKHAYTVITSEIGYLPLRTDIVDDPAYLKGWVAEHPLVQPNLEQLKVLEPWESMPGPNYRQIVKTMTDATEMSVFGGADIKATMTEAQTRAQAMMPNGS